MSKATGMTIVDLVKTSKGIKARNWTVRPGGSEFIEHKVSADLVKMCREIAIEEVAQAEPAEELSRSERADRVAILEQVLLARWAGQ